MAEWTFLGLIAGFFTTIAFLPQLLKAWQTKSTRDISLGTFLLFCFGVFLWLVYGFLVNDLPILVNNIVTLIIALAILALKLKYR